ncbi:MAG: ATP-binding cassette, subfamily bacterial IrtA/YbtP [Mycobacterium sp.]|nr:ATP-binding cassette, subfamily bacterial IrtA/YbtP [Mycobacterium sp.]
MVVGGLLVRTFAGGVALTLTHHADVDLQGALRRRIVDTLGRLPLGWFGATSSCSMTPCWRTSGSADQTPVMRTSRTPPGRRVLRRSCSAFPTAGRPGSAKVGRHCPVVSANGFRLPVHC